MATSAYVLCGLCEDQDITKHADQWCPECEEGLCIGCLKFHKSSKATKHHDVISVENFKKLPTNISSIVHHCKEHDRRYQNYCPHHESLCCPVCIATDHNKCNDLLVMDDIIKNAKSSSLLESIEESIEILKRNLQLLIEEKDSNLNKNKTMKNDFLEQIKKVREQINAHFDKLEQQLKKDILAAEKQIKGQTDSLSKELKEKLRATEELQKNVVDVKEYASDLQTCLGSMSLKTKVEKEEKYIQCLKENGQLNQILLKCTLDEKILAEILSLETFGLVSTNKIPSTVDFMQGKRRAQMTSGPIPRVPKSFDEINLALKYKFEIPVCETSKGITGCGFRPNGEIMVVDHANGRLLIFDENEQLKKIVNLPSLRPTDVTSVNDKSICVSYCDGNRLDLINADSYEPIQIIKTNALCCGVTSEQGTLYWYEQGKGIQMKRQTNDDIITLVKADDNCYWCYVSVYDGRIYQTNPWQKTVKCFELDGQKIWEFKDNSILSYPTGITVDGDSNAYIADPDKGIFVLSNDGKNCRHILGVTDEMSNIYALAFDRKRNQLIVIKYNGQVFMHNIA